MTIRCHRKTMGLGTLAHVKKTLPRLNDMRLSLTSSSFIISQRSRLNRIWLSPKSKNIARRVTTGAVLIIHELVIHGMYLGMTRGQITILPQPEIQRSFGGIPWKTTTICDESCPSSMDLTSGGKLPPQHKHGTLDL